MNAPASTDSANIVTVSMPALVTPICSAFARHLGRRQRVEPDRGELLGGHAASRFSAEPRIPPASGSSPRATAPAPPGRGRRSSRAPSRRATPPAGRRRHRLRDRPRARARTCSSPRVPMRHGVHFWHDSSAKKRIVSRTRRRTGYETGNTWTPAEPTAQPHSASASRVSGVSSAAGGRTPEAAPPGTIAPISPTAPPAYSSRSVRRSMPFGAS